MLNATRLPFIYKYTHTNGSITKSKKQNRGQRSHNNPGPGADWPDELDEPDIRTWREVMMSTLGQIPIVLQTKGFTNACFNTGTPFIEILKIYLFMFS